MGRGGGGGGGGSLTDPWGAVDTGGVARWAGSRGLGRGVLNCRGCVRATPLTPCVNPRKKQASRQGPKRRETRVTPSPAVKSTQHRTQTTQPHAHEGKGNPTAYSRAQSRVRGEADHTEPWGAPPCVPSAGWTKGYQGRRRPPGSGGGVVQGGGVARGRERGTGERKGQ